MTDAVSLPADLRRWLAKHLPAVADASWPRPQSRVWRLMTPATTAYLKVSPSEQSYTRETTAYRLAADALGDHSPRLIATDPALRAILTTALPGTPVRDLLLSPPEEATVHRHAGLLLRRWHDHPAAVPLRARDEVRTAMAAHAREAAACLVALGGLLSDSEGAAAGDGCGCGTSPTRSGSALGHTLDVSARTKSENLLLPIDVRRRLQAVVVDANAYGRVGPDLASLAALAKDLSTIDIEVWVPEPVAWEWAEHLAKQWAAARAAFRSAAPLRKAGLLPVLQFENHYENQSAVIEAFLARLQETPYVQVVPLTPGSAIEGLKDQVLQRRPAKTKSDVKTGGSDSAWLRTVLDKVDHAADTLLFLSSDGDIRQAYEQWGHEPPLLRAAQEIRDSLFKTLPTSAEDAWLIADYLVGRMPIDLQAPASEDDSAVIGTVTGLIAALQHHPDDEAPTTAHLTRLTALAGVTELTRPETDTFMADVYFLAEAEAARTVQDDQSGETLTTYTQAEAGLLVRSRMMFKVRDQAVTSMRADSEATAFSSRNYSDPDEAWEAVGEALIAVPGVRLVDEWGSWWNMDDQSFKVAGKDQNIETYWTRSDWGTLNVQIGEEELSVSCEHDLSSWVGGRDGLYLEPPYYLSADVPGAERNPAWGIPAWIIGQLTGQGGQPPT